MNHRLETLMTELQAEDFALYETALYLDGHPEDEAALAYLQQQEECVAKLRLAVEETGYPLSFTGGRSCEYNWVTEPWPWQKGAC